MEISGIARNVAFRINSLAAGALVSVIVLGLLGAQSSIGLFPYAESQNSADAVSGGPAAGSEAGACYRCGTVESVRVVLLRGDASGLGAAAAAIGSHSDRGRGNPAMTNPGTADGAFPGNDIANDPKKHLAYRVTVRRTTAPTERSRSQRLRGSRLATR